MSCHRLYFIFSLLFDVFFFFNDTATTEIYTLSLHDALPISAGIVEDRTCARLWQYDHIETSRADSAGFNMIVLPRSEEHTSELQSHSDLVCRLLLEKKKKQ